MHGRQRVELSPEEEAKKQKERQHKVTAYQFAMGKIFDKRSKSELDSEMLAIIGQVLAANPDIATLWNIRKETLLKMKDLDETEFLEKAVPKELDFSEFCLKTNPKSYGAWYHRYWLMKETDFKRVADELKLCSKYLEYDDRNFHCWDYRRFLMDNCSLVTLEEELQFTKDKIATNFSNFSSWHLRSKLLPRLSKSYLEDELDLIRNAAFTDPKDQSSWLYHLWLLKSQLEKETPKLTVLKWTNAHLIACFNIPVPMPCEEDIKFNEPHGTFKSPLATGRSKLWIMNFPDSGTEKNAAEIFVSGNYIQKSFNQESMVVQFGVLYGQFDPYFDEETKPKTPSFENLLRDELSWVQELQELEPEIKWPVYTAMILMRMISFNEFRLQITECLNTLLEIDPKRTNYYNDLRSKYTMEWILTGSNADLDNVDLSGLQLTSLYHSERLCCHNTINCSNNKLKNSESLSSFVNCSHLNIRNNQIPIDIALKKVLQGLRNLKELTILDKTEGEADLSAFLKDFTASVNIF